MLRRTHLKWYANSAESNYMQKSKQQLNQLVAVLLLWETLSLPNHFWSWQPKNMAILQLMQIYLHRHLHTHTHTHTHARAHTYKHTIKAIAHTNNSYCSTLSTPIKIWQFTIKMVVTSKVALRKHLCKTAHIVQLGLERGFLYKFFTCSQNAESSKQISE